MQQSAHSIAAARPASAPCAALPLRLQMRTPELPEHSLASPLSFPRSLVLRALRNAAAMVAAASSRKGGGESRAPPRAHQGRESLSPEVLVAAFHKPKVRMSEQEVAPEEVNVLKRNSDDVGWEYGFLVDPNNKDKVECKFCGHRSQGGIHRLKEHVANVGTNAKKEHESIPFNACDNDEFKQMCESIGQFGSRLEPPSQCDLRESLLDEEYARTKSLLQERDAEKVKNGCSIMTDAWSDRKRRSIMNLCTNCADGSSFISSKEMSDVSHTSEVIFELVDKAIEDIGPNHVVQVVTDNASNNIGAKNRLAEKRPNIFWTSCATHTINLMLQGIGNMPWFKKKDVKLCLSVFEPLVKVLRLVDGDVKPSMCFLYGELLKAKREIKEAYGNVETRYKKVIAIIDKKMKERLDSPLHLTAYLLNPYYSYANPSIFDEPTITEIY
ncbi:uncharacterized protein [Miscanthus floridulus]|uniref:uncharacterized protein n=1 Tax=Miscanthus floridulus TaxID=154761 RepID=UPI00345A3DEB